MFTLITLEFTPYACSPFRTTIVVSESLFQFLNRNLGMKDKNDKLIILFSTQMENQEDYLKLKKFNPTNDGCYFHLKKEDWSKYYK